MRICRFLPLATPGQGDDPGGCVGPYGIATRHFQWVDAPGACVGLLDGDLGIVDLTAAGFPPLAAMLELEDLAQQLTACLDLPRPRIPLSSVRLLAPVESQEVWAAGVTYLRSKTARMEESEFSASAYDRVYAAERPELFFKALAEKVVHPGEPVGIRRDSRWSVPEPELALVFNSRGQFVGCTVGNDVSARDIEGENLLYLPQAKVYCRSCALGPFLVVGVDEATVRILVRDFKQHVGKAAFPHPACCVYHAGAHSHLIAQGKNHQQHEYWGPPWEASSARLSVLRLRKSHQIS